jgi:type III restriction enzyme
MVLEDAPEVLRWCKSGEGDILIYWNADSRYVPDFIVETKTDKWLCEIKAENEMTTDEVQRKAQAAVVWCKHATDYELKNGGKAWSYALIPSLQVTAQATYKTLVERFCIS